MQRKIVYYFQQKKFTIVCRDSWFIKFKVWFHNFSLHQISHYLLVIIIAQTVKTGSGTLPFHVLIFCLKVDLGFKKWHETYDVLPLVCIQIDLTCDVECTLLLNKRIKIQDSFTTLKTRKRKINRRIIVFLEHIKSTFSW